MRDLWVKEHVFWKQEFASLHGDLEFCNNLQLICQTMTATLNIVESSMLSSNEDAQKQYDQSNQERIPR